MSDFSTEELAILHALLVNEREFMEDVGENQEPEYQVISQLEKKVKDILIPPEIVPQPDGASPEDSLHCGMGSW